MRRDNRNVDTLVAATSPSLSRRARLDGVSKYRDPSSSEEDQHESKRKRSSRRRRGGEPEEAEEVRDTPALVKSSRRSHSRRSVIAQQSAEATEDVHEDHSVHQKSTTGHFTGRRSSQSSQVESEEEDEEEENEDEEDRKQSVRVRVPTKIENVRTLGGDGGGLSKTTSSSRGFDRDLRDVEVRSYKEPRMHFGGRIPNAPHPKRSHRSRHRRRESRRHYDSSSESGSSVDSYSASSDGDGEDAMFRRHERKRLRQEVDQPFLFCSSPVLEFSSYSGSQCSL